MITFENVTKKYANGTVAVDSLHFEIKQGEFFVIIGPSGCGKTTTLKMINRLIPLTGGTIFIDDEKISEYHIHELRWNIGYVLQQIALFPHMTIEENITIVPEMKQWSKEKIKHRAHELLEMVGLDPDTYANRKPHQLSGGEQQRVGVIRALAADPDIILMDEPFSALDPISREKLQDDLLDIKENLKKTTVFVTHDMNEALLLADRICLMKDGKIAQIGTPHELMNNPATDFVKQFVGNNRGVLDDFNLRNILLPLRNGDALNPANTIAVDTPINEVMKKLSEHDQLVVEENGTAIGMITRQHVFAHLLESLQKRGIANE